MKVCPMCNGKHFYIRAILDQTWLVDGDGKQLSVTRSETIRDKDDNSEWVCVNCGHVARGCDLVPLKRKYTVTISYTTRGELDVSAFDENEAYEIAAGMLGDDENLISYTVKDENGEIVLDGMC